MYVYKLVESVEYEGNIWSVLIKGDEQAFSKIKNLILKSLVEELAEVEEKLKRIEESKKEFNNSYIFKRTIKAIELTKENIKKVEGFSKIEHIVDIENSNGYSIEVYKLEVI